MDDVMDTNHREGFSDNVFAVAITLLAFDLHASARGASLAQRLAEPWPSYVAFLVSFALIGVVWLTHHQMFRDIRAADPGLIVANLALLLIVTAYPFPTRVVAEAFQTGTGADHRTAALVYGFWNVAIGLALNALWWTARGRRLVELAAPQARLAARIALP
jgi:uncharacterized membrane protein